MRRAATTGTALCAALLTALLLCADRRAEACDRLQVELMPGSELQLAVWITTLAGDYVDTIKVTRLVGTFGIGNRPGRPSTAPGGGLYTNFHWPYGKRLEVLPVWAYGRGVFYPMLVMQDTLENQLGFHNSYSSDDPFFCKPQTLVESGVDMSTCASEGFNSDKGVFDPAGAVVPYPPRNDITTFGPSDSADAPMLPGMNDLDAVTLATPAAGALVLLDYDASTLVPGDYVVWVEASAENDPNPDWNPSTVPCFPATDFPDVGACVNGQPSVVWQVPFHIDGPDDAFVLEALDYRGYGAPDGSDGTVRPADGTITTGADGTGEGRLLAMTDLTGADYRVRLTCEDGACENIAPFPVTMAAQVPTDETDGADINEVTVRVVHPADDDGGPVSLYEIRYAEGMGALDELSFMTGGSPAPAPAVGPPGQTAEVVISDLGSDTVYTVGIRARDECLNWSPVFFFEVKTDKPVFTTVRPCGCSARGGPAAPRTGGAAGTGLVAALVLGAAVLLRGRRARRRSPR